MGRYITTTGTAGAIIREVSSAFNASVNDRILADTSTAGFIITLPANGTLLQNDTIQIIDIGNAMATNNLTVARNLSKINGLTEDLVINVSGSVITLTYTGSNYGWVIAGS
jgi:hypothetical protein